MITNSKTKIVNHGAVAEIFIRLAGKVVCLYGVGLAFYSVFINIGGLYAVRTNLLLVFSLSLVILGLVLRVQKNVTTQYNNRLKALAGIMSGPFIIVLLYAIDQAIRSVCGENNASCIELNQQFTELVSSGFIIWISLVVSALGSIWMWIIIIKSSKHI